MTVDLLAPEERLEGLRRRAATERGRAEAEVQAVASLIERVAAAKGRQALRPRAEEILLGVREDAAAARLSAYERLVGAFRSDVVPGPGRVVLRTGIEKRRTTLEVLKDSGEGLEDVYRDTGGGLDNVVSTAFRLIATVRGGGTRFLALDEPDCWLAPDRVAPFLRVLRATAARLDVQILLVTHNDVSHLEDGPDLLRYAVHRTADGMSVDPLDPVGRTGVFRTLEVADLQAIPHARIDLAGGLTVVSGPNDVGKSALLRGLRAMLEGGGGPTLVRHGAPEASVTLELGDVRVTWRRRRKPRTPAQSWTVEGPEGTVERPALADRTPPPEVLRTLGVPRGTPDGLMVAHQKRPMFLLDTPPTERAGLLDVGREVGWASEALDILRRDAGADARDIAHGEGEIQRLGTPSRRLERLAGDVEPRLDALRRGLEHVRDGLTHAAACERSAALVRRAESATRRAERTARLLATSPKAPPEGAGVAYDASRNALAAATTVRLAERSARFRGEVVRVLSGLLPPPAAAPSDDAARAADGVRRALVGVATATRALRSLRIDLHRTTDDVTVALDDLGGACPTCGTPVRVDDVLRGRHRQ